MKAIGQFLHHLCLDRPDRWHPLLGVYYLTYACEFRCPYCSDGSGRPYYRLYSPVLSGRKVVELLQRIRRHCEHLVVTGGEPLEHSDCREVLEALPSLRFRSVTLTTNGHAIGPLLPLVVRSVQVLVFSLQTLDSRRADAWYGRGAGTHQQILDNIDAARCQAGRSGEIVLSSVVTPENIPDLYEVYAYARERNFRLAACPQLVGVKAHPGLENNPEYRRFFDFLIAEKRRGGRIHGTVDYLRYMRDLRKFACHPFTMLVVSPGGDVFYPCLEMGHSAGNLFCKDDLHRLRQQGCAKFGPQPDCDTRCHSACALGFSRLLENPASLLHEAALAARARFRSFL